MPPVEKVQIRDGDVPVRLVDVLGTGEGTAIELELGRSSRVIRPAPPEDCSR